MMSNDNDNNQPKPSAALAAVEKYLVYIDSVIQKLENGTRNDKSINSMSQLEQELKSLWQQTLQFIENELASNNNKSIKSEQERAVLEQQYSKFTDSYICYLDKIIDTALSILKIILPIIPALLAINVQTQWFSIAVPLWGFSILSIFALLIVGYFSIRRKKYIDVEAKRLLDEIDLSKEISQKSLAEAEAKYQYAKELLNRINTSLSKVECLKNPPNNSGS
ncbi:MAG: hypothetical protein HUU08_16615 [Candidatus Brocadia sp.]|nr:hypothetical protein [Candidatus Brocadia sp.]